MTKATFRSIAAIIGVIFLSVILSYCGEEEDSGNVPVSVTFSIPAAAKSSAAPAFKSITVPPNVLSITINISASDISTINDTFNVSPGSTITRNYNVLSGPDRTFTASVYSGASGTGFLLYEGSETSDVPDPEPPVIITMAEAPYTGLYVDVNRGVDVTGGSPLNPYRTITFALSQTGGSEEINVAAGTYNTLSGELFPLQLKAGTALKCVGAGYTTVIERNGDYSSAILGADGASIEGCKITNAGPAIDDAGTQMTVNNNFIEGGCEGIWAQGNSTITNNGIRAMLAGDCYDAGILVYSFTGGTPTPTISNNTIIGSDNGIYIETGANPTINNNSITGNFIGVYAGYSSLPLVTGNTITGNEFGVEILDKANPKLNNNILSCNIAVDVMTYSGLNIDATNNRWDHIPPSQPAVGCDQNGEDICYAAGIGSIVYTGATLASSPCP